MSRTYKDKPSKLKHEPYWQDRYLVSDNYFHYYIYVKSTKAKKRKEVDTENHWMTTPSWWINLRMNKPQRREAHMLEKKVLRVEDIEDLDFPNLKRKPHIYYW